MLEGILSFFMEGEELNIVRILLSLAIGFLIIKMLFRKSYGSSYPPTAKGLYVPWFGHMFAFGAGPIEFFTEQFQKLGEVFSFVLFGRDMVFLCGPEAHKAFFNAPEDVLCAREAYKFMIPCFGPGVAYDAPDSKFQQQRKMAGSALTVQWFRVYIPKIEQEVNDYLDKYWGKEGTVDFDHAIGEITILTSTSCLQGPEIRAQVNQGYANYMHDIDRALSTIGFFYPGLPLPAYRNRDIARRKIGAMFKAILKKRRSENIKGEDVLQVFMDSKYDDGSNLTDDEIVGLMVALMLAGQHTSNITSSWAILFILSNKELFKRILEEQDKVGGSSSENLTYESVNEMELLGNSVKETLRLRPPIIIIFRKVMQEFRYKEFVVPAGALACVSPPVYAQMEKSAFKNPHEFDPDRYNKERKEDKKEPYAYFPFSQGRHACIGEKFAYLQVKAILAVIFKNYELELIGTLEDYPIDKTSLLASPKGPIKIKYKKRN